MSDADTDADRVLVCNPASGSEDHVERVTDLAREHGFHVSVTEEAGDATRLARSAATDGARLVAAAGGDGTVNEVVNGIYEADALDETSLAVVPTGTGNNFATNLGIEDVADAFAVIETGEQRRIDLGVANDRVFVNSCIGGITAEASGATTAEEKRAFGILSYVARTIETVASFDPLPLRVTLEDHSEAESSPETWVGEAAFVLVGNCRRFTSARCSQANVEDGLFEVTIVEKASAIDLVGEAALEGLFDREATHIVRQRVPTLTVESLRADPIEYSLDGEMLETETLELSTAPRSLEVAVGSDYRPDPDERTAARDRSAVDLPGCDR